MGLQVEDGTGKGYLQKVDANNDAHVRSRSLSEEAILARDSGCVYCGTSGSGQLDLQNGTVMYLKNLSSTQELVVERLLVSIENAGAFVNCRLNDTGTAGTTTTVPMVNTNTNFPALPTTVAEMYKPSSTGITGLTAGDEIAYFDDLAAGRSTFPIDGTFVLNQNGVFTVTVGTSQGGGALTGRVSWVVRFRMVTKGT